MTAVPIVYIAGPYRASTAWRREQNIHAAREWGVAVAQAGAYPVIPHSNTAHFDGEADDALWLAGSMELMRRCDGVLMTGAWEQSSGSRAEHAEAMRLGIPVFHPRSDDFTWSVMIRACQARVRMR